MDTIEQFLATMAEMVASMNNTRIGDYHSIMEFVLKNGTPFNRIGKRPKSIRKGRRGYCFANAARLSLNCEHLTYCEGYATGIIPVMHAWCVTKNGTVIDPTWNDGNAYYGVQIKRSYLMHSMYEYGGYGVIDIWKHQWPILKEKRKTFLHTL
jgi:hypothetical protein